jgi:hypothetical protein
MSKVLRRPRRLVLRCLVVCALVAAPLAAAGCGAGSHYFGNVIAHHIANHFAKTPQARRRVNRAFCIYSVYRTFHDFTHHHFIFGALNAHQALKNCEAGFARSAPLRR